MVVLGLLILIWGMLRDKKLHQTTRDESALNIYKEQLQELDRDKEAGVITDEQHSASIRELERSLLASSGLGDEVNTDIDVQNDNNWPSIIAVSILLPLIAIPLYMHLGEPDLIPTLESIAIQQEGSGQAEQGPTMEAMLEILSQRLEEDPNNAEGLMLLARSYLSIGRVEESIVAFEKLNALVGDVPVVLLSYAEALIMRNQGRVTGEPESIINKILEIEPGNESGLILSGLAAEEQGNFEKAISNWNRVLPSLTDPAQIAQIEERIRELGGPVSAVTVDNANGADQDNGSGISVSIDLSDELKGKVSPGDTLFIFARATTGPPMPLAAVRKTVSDLPLDVRLDDSMAMMPALKLSGFDSVQVSARISLSGEPTSSSGDLEAVSVTAIPGQDEIVSLEINTVVP
jgi:cytochrome c-type biogenesis protein CcmH